MRTFLLKIEIFLSKYHFITSPNIDEIYNRILYSIPSKKCRMHWSFDSNHTLYQGSRQYALTIG